MCDGRDGLIRWINTDLPYNSAYGVASSLINYGNAVIVQSDSDEIESYVVALSEGNGRAHWRRARDGRGSWRSPICFSWNDRGFLCSWAADYADLYEPDSGKLIRRILGVECGIGDPVASPVFDGEALWFVGAERAIAVSMRQLLNTEQIEVCLCESGQTSETNSIVAAANIDLDYEGPTCSTPAYSNNLLVSVSDIGHLLCISTAEEKVLWKTDLGETVSSPIISDGYVFTVNKAGLLRFFALNAGYEVPKMRQVDLSEEVQASPVEHNGCIYVRTKSKLYCLAPGESNRIAPNTD